MSSVSTILARLKRELHTGQNSSQFEYLVAALFGHFLGVPIAVAKSGFQYGGDAGPAGQQGRRFRLECKHYQDTSHLSERELLGEFDQALVRDTALEAWILVTTRRVSEQLRQSLTQHGEQNGVPIVIVDWSEDECPPLAALCAGCPEVVRTRLSEAAGVAARALQPVFADAIDSLRRNLESWCLGFEFLKRKSDEKLAKIWNSRRESTSVLGQNVAGGSRQNKIRRNVAEDTLNDWWRRCASCDAPAAIIGLEGAGKTWTTLNWLTDNIETQPVVLIVPSSAVSPTLRFSEISVKQFLAERLYDMTAVRNSEYWLRRLNLLLRRPDEEGPLLTIFFDGLNQEPSVFWLTLFKILQGEIFAGKIRLIISTRNHYFESKLSNLNGLVVPVVPIEINTFDNFPGGELDQMLDFERLGRSDFHPDVLEMARTPRLFDLVVRFRESLGASGPVTIHRLLWEYWRDSIGVRAGHSFSEDEWQDWLREIARTHRDGIHRFTQASLGQTVSRPDLTETDVYRRLSDIIDGRFATRTSTGELQLTAEVVSHALGCALVNELTQVEPPAFDALDAKLKEWLDPISGFSELAEILRAAVSIIIQQERLALVPVTSVLLTSWLQAQNVTDAHRQEIVELAPHLVAALLDVVEHSESRTHDSARAWAVKAIQTIPRTDSSAFSMIVARLRRWLQTVNRGIDTSSSANEEHNKWRSDRLIKRIGNDSPGTISVAGIELELVDRPTKLMQAAVPEIIVGFPLAEAIPIFQAAATEMAVTGRSMCWDNLRWLCLLNEDDPVDTAISLRELSTRISQSDPEPGVHPDLNKRIAALLLWLTGQETDDEAAATLNPSNDDTVTYENNYLPQPSTSWFPLERRHARLTLIDTNLRVEFRIQRIGDLWLDPYFEPPDSFITELREKAASIDMRKLYQRGGRSIEDLHFEELEPALARCAPDLLADLIRRKIQSLATCPQEARYRNARQATDHLILAGKTEMAACQALRLSDGGGDRDSESLVACHLLLIELRDLDGQEQFDALIQADLTVIWDCVSNILRRLNTDDVDTLIDRYTAASQKQQRNLLTLLSLKPVKLSNGAWTWVDEFRRRQNHQASIGIVFKILSRADSIRFGNILLEEGWSWDPTDKDWVNHYGTDALINASLSLPFQEVAPKLAPWTLLEAVRRRGNDPQEVQFATRILDLIVMQTDIEEPDPGSDLSIDLMTVKSFPLAYSVTLRRSENEVENMRLAFDADAQLHAYRRAIDTAASRIREARQSGAPFFNVAFDPADFKPILQHASSFVDRWLEGCCEPTAEFQCRIRLAEGFFLGLCEALLEYKPETGAKLWRALRASMVTRYIGDAGVEDHDHMVFRVPDSSAVASLRDELTELKYCHTDRELFDVAIAASHNGNAQWIEKIVEEDRMSALPWRQARAKVLDGFRTNNSLPNPAAWPEGELKTNSTHLTWMAARSQYVEACARRWWQTYLKAQDPASAYASWVLFLRSADRRSWIWMTQDADSYSEPTDLFDLKVAHLQVNRRNLKRAMQEREKKFDQNFLQRKVGRNIGPWL